MMDRAELAGLGVATAAHVALLVALSLGFAAARLPVSKADPIEVSFVEEIGLENAAPAPSATPPAPLLAPEEGPPQPAAMPSPPRLQPVPQPRSNASAAKPSPTPPPAAKPAQTRATGRLAGLLKGVSDRESDSRSTAPPAAVMNAQAAASIGSLIRRQVQPCADRMVNPGPGASRIKVRINLKLNRNGSLQSPPTVEGDSGLDDENRRYAQRVKEMAIAAFTSCSPLRGLPPDLYAVSNGWSDFDMIYNLP